MSLTNDVESIVIVSYPEGYVATLRFKNPLHDIILSAKTKFVIHSMISRYIYVGSTR